MIVRTLLAIALLAIVIGSTGCGGSNGATDDASTSTEAATDDTSTSTEPVTDDSSTSTEAATDDTSTSTEPAGLTAFTLPSGATVSYPSDWTSYGAGFSGSLELNIPGVANVSVRDAEASAYLYGPALPDQESLQDAFAMFALGLGGAEIGESTPTTVDGRDMLIADVVNEGRAAVMAITESGDSFASVYAEATGDALPPEAVESVLQVLASTTP